MRRVYIQLLLQTKLDGTYILEHNDDIVGQFTLKLKKSDIYNTIIFKHVKR